MFNLLFLFICTMYRRTDVGSHAIPETSNETHVQRAQYSFIEEVTLDHTKDPVIIQGVFLVPGVLGPLWCTERAQGGALGTARKRQGTSPDTRLLRAHWNIPPYLGQRVDLGFRV